MFRRIVSLLLAVVCLVSVAAVTVPVRTSAAAATYIVPGEYRLESAAKSNVMWNLYGNCSASCTKICTWQKDNSPEQVLVFRYEGDGAYRIYYRDHSTKCTDVLRYTSPLKSGQKVELYEDTDDIAQLLIPYKVNEYTVIFRMKADPSLAISVNKTSNGSQLVLKPFKASDKKQQWIFRSTSSSFKKVSAFTTEEPGSSAAAVIPESMYSLTGAAYTVDGEIYRQARLVKDMGSGTNTKAGTVFWMDADNGVVTAPDTLNRLQDLTLVNDMRENFLSILEHWQVAAGGYYDVFTEWTRIGSFGSVMGASLGVATGAAITGGINLADVGLEVLSTVADPQNVCASAYLGMVRVYSTNVMNCSESAISMLQTPVTSYADAEAAMNLYALAAANQSAIEHLVGDTVREIADSAWYDFTAHYLKETVCGFAGAVIPDITAAQLTNYILQGSVSLAEFAMSSGTVQVYEDAFAEGGAFLGNSYPALQKAAEELAAAAENPGSKYVASGLQGKVNQLMQIYKPGSRKTTIFSKANAWQCHGFACEALMLFWDTAKPTPSNKQYTYYKATSSKSYVEQIRPGDMVRYRSGDYDHTIVITNVDDDYVYYADCNADGKCTFAYDKQMSLDKLDILLRKVLIDQAVSKRGYVCHYKYNDL